ncbi:SPARC-like protein 1 [Bienertia sinuspersici]
MANPRKVAYYKERKRQKVVLDSLKDLQGDQPIEMLMMNQQLLLLFVKGKEKEEIEEIMDERISWIATLEEFDL